MTVPFSRKCWIHALWSALAGFLIISCVRIASVATLLKSLVYALILRCFHVLLKRLSPLKGRIPLSQLMALSLDNHQMLYGDRLLHFLVPQLAASTALTSSTVVTLSINTISAAFIRLIVFSSRIPKVNCKSKRVVEWQCQSICHIWKGRYRQLLVVQDLMLGDMVLKSRSSPPQLHLYIKMTLAHINLLKKTWMCVLSLLKFLIRVLPRSNNMYQSSQLHLIHWPLRRVLVSFSQPFLHV